MSGKDRDEVLRRMAQHRGLKLVKSRRRKPGVGDYGRYGLTDANGKALFGFGADGLTATPDQIEAHLHKGEIATWQTSVAATPARIAVKNRPTPSQKRPDKPATAKPSRAARSFRAEPVPAPPVEKPRPALAIRAARPGDTEAIAALLAELKFDATAKIVAGRLAEIAATGDSVLVADRGGVIGVIALARVPMLQHAPVGRITLLIVARRERRTGIGRMLVDAAVSDLAKRGCEMIEAMSDIEIRNAHGFFRALGFEQTSYRFTRRSPAISRIR